MTAVEAVIERLEGLTALTALVATRIFNSVASEGCASPFVVVRNISDRREQHLRGMTDLTVDRVQVDFYVDETSGADAKGQANAGGDIIFGDGNGPNASGLAGWVGTVGGSPATAAILNVSPAGRRDEMEFDEVRRWCDSQDFMVSWKRMQ